MTDALLRTINLTKHYGTVTVLDDFSFDVRSGEIHALLGANGAGKSTLCKIVAGLIPSSAGRMTFDGQDYGPRDRQSAELCGVQIIQQELNLIPTLSVAENLLFTRLPNRGGVIRSGTLHRKARSILDQFGLPDIDGETSVGSLGVGRQQMVEIAAALACECRLLILDEPTAALSGAETAQLFSWLNQLRQQGVAMIYISHRLDEIVRLTDRITILRDGRYVCTHNTPDVSTAEMVRLTSGDSVGSSTHSHKSCVVNQIALKVDAITCGIVKDVSFNVRRGERLGVAGLVGSGRTELLRAVFGADIATSGKLSLRSEEPQPCFRSPAQAVAAGLAMVTEDRKYDGLLLSHSVRSNSSLAALQARFSARGLIDSQTEHQCVESLCQTLDIRSTGVHQPVGMLSGGNQQKVAVAKWLIRDADVFLFDEPTRGIDVAARQRIYQLFESLAQDGKAVVIASSDLEELLDNCDRILVMSAGRVAAEFERGEWTEEKITQAAFSGYSEAAVS